MLLALKMKNVCGGSGKVREVAGRGGGMDPRKMVVTRSWKKEIDSPP